MDKLKNILRVASVVLPLGCAVASSSVAINNVSQSADLDQKILTIQNAMQDAETVLKYSNEDYAKQVLSDALREYFSTDAGTYEEALSNAQALLRNLYEQAKNLHDKGGLGTLGTVVSVGAAMALAANWKEEIEENKRKNAVVGNFDDQEMSL